MISEVHKGNHIIRVILNIKIERNKIYNLIKYFLHREVLASLFYQ